MRDSTTKAVCNACKQFAPLRTRRTLAEGSTLPSVLCINAAVHAAEIIPDFWTDKPSTTGGDGGAFLPVRFGVGRSSAGGRLEDVRIMGPARKDAWGPDASEYELRALVIETHAGTEDRHLVSIVKSAAPAAPPFSPLRWFCPVALTPLLSSGCAPSQSPSTSSTPRPHRRGSSSTTFLSRMSPRRRPSLLLRPGRSVLPALSLTRPTSRPWAHPLATDARAHDL